MDKTPIAPGSAAHTLLLHLLSTPDIADKLNTLHDLALYESGGALLGPEEKEALRDVKELQMRLGNMSEKCKEDLLGVL